MDYTLLVFSALYLVYAAIIESTQPARHGAITGVELLALFSAMTILGYAVASIGDAVI